MTPEPLSAAEIEQLRRTAENPLARSSERVEARRRLVELGVVPGRRGLWAHYRAKGPAAEWRAVKGHTPLFAYDSRCCWD